MKLNLRNFSGKPNHENSGRRKKEQDAVKIDAAIKSALDELGDDAGRKAAFLRLLTCVRAHTSLLGPTPGRGTPGWIAPVFLINRLKNLATRQAHWIRPCETWRWAGNNLRLTSRSLAHHLLAIYPVPGFMDSAWDLPAGPQAFREQSWFIRLGRGASVRKLNLPLILTRGMEHHVRHAPDDYTVTQALRYGETKGLGGGEELAREVATGWLGRRIEHPDFWRTVLNLFVAHPEMKLEHVNPIVDFVHANKFADDEVQTEDGIVSRTAPWPDFSMKGRTLKSILRLAAAWHSDLSANGPAQCFSWKASGIAAYRFLEKRADGEHDLEWEIHELLSSGALHAEGRAMRHCVYSYAGRCRRGETTIWSLRLRIDGEEKRMVTIEVDPRRRSIIQARAKCNLRPGARSLEIIRQWADWAGIGFELNF